MCSEEKTAAGAGIRLSGIRQPTSVMVQTRDASRAAEENGSAGAIVRF
jgi:hypothetical protein